MAQARVTHDNDINLGTRSSFSKLEAKEHWQKTAWVTPWWKEFISDVKEWRNEKLEKLSDANQELSQRMEDRLRGEIACLNFILWLDVKGRNLNDPKLQELEAKLKEINNGDPVGNG